VIVERVPAPGDTLAEDAASSIRARTGFVPAVAVVLGSGLGASLAIDEEVSLAYRDIAGFPEPTVPGHGGRLALGTVAGARIAAFHGRFHRYEGHSFPVCALPVRVARGLGAGTLVLTAAVGSLDPSLAPGDVVVARDHVNLMGGNPLEGWRFPDGTPAFVDLSEVYDRQMAELAGSKAETLGIRVHPGVYVSVRGPSYETPAEAEFLRRAGGTVVGMSVVPEAVPARALGMRVVGLFAVTNAVGTHTSHEDVVRASSAAAGAVAELLEAVLPEMEGG